MVEKPVSLADKMARRWLLRWGLLAGGATTLSSLPLSDYSIVKAAKANIECDEQTNVRQCEEACGMYSSRFTASIAHIDARVQAIHTAGYMVAGDGGGARYHRAASAPPHNGRFQSADMGWWELAETSVRPEMYGAVGDGLSDDDVAMMGMADQARGRGYLDCTLAADKIYTYTHPTFLSGIRRIHIEGNGAGFRNICGDKIGPAFSVNGAGLVFTDVFSSNGPANYLGASTPTYFGERIETAIAGERRLVISNSGRNFSAGDPVLIYGFDAQGNASYPPCVRFFEYAEVLSVAGATITLDAPLKYSYDSAWPENTLSEFHYGRPRIISRVRPDFVEVDLLHIRNLRIHKNPGWTAPLATDERNGRLQVCGYRKAILENVEVDGGMYPGQGQEFVFRGGKVKEKVETDKLIEVVRYEDCDIAQHALGIGAKRIEFVNARVSGAFSASPQEVLLIDGGQFQGQADGGSNHIIATFAGVRRINVQNKARFFVAESGRSSLLAYTNYAIRISVERVGYGKNGVGTISLPRTAYDTSFVCRALYEHGLLYDADGAPAFRVTRLPYQEAGIVRMDGIFKKALGTGDTLYAPQVQEATVDAVYDGPHGGQIPTIQQTSGVWDGPTSIMILDHQRGHGRWRFSSDNMDQGLAEAFFQPGKRVLPSRITIHVAKAYTGRTEPVGLSIKQHGANPDHS